MLYPKSEGSLQGIQQRPTKAVKTVRISNPRQNHQNGIEPDRSAIKEYGLRLVREAQTPSNNFADKDSLGLRRITLVGPILHFHLPRLSHGTAPTRNCGDDRH